RSEVVEVVFENRFWQARVAYEPDALRGAGSDCGLEVGIGEIEANQSPVLINGRQPGIPAQAKIESQFGVYFPVVLKIEGGANFAQVSGAPVVLEETGFITEVETGEGVSGSSESGGQSCAGGGLRLLGAEAVVAWRVREVIHVNPVTLHFAAEAEGVRVKHLHELGGDVEGSRVLRQCSAGKDIDVGEIGAHAREWNDALRRAAVVDDLAEIFECLQAWSFGDLRARAAKCSHIDCAGERVREDVGVADGQGLVAK